MSNSYDCDYSYDPFAEGKKEIDWVGWVHGTGRSTFLSSVGTVAYQRVCYTHSSHRQLPRSGREIGLCRVR